MDNASKNQMHLSKAKIIIADDTEFFRTLLGDVLKAEGYDILFAADGKEALDLIHSHGSEIALLILDIVMPEFTGKEVLETLNAEHFVRTFPVLIMTGYKQYPEEIKAFRELGIEGFISKTEPPRFFVARIKQTLQTPLT